MKILSFLFIFGSSASLAQQNRVDFQYEYYRPPGVQLPQPESRTGRAGEAPNQRDIEHAERGRVLSGQREQNAKIQGARDSARLKFIENLRSFHHKGSLRGPAAIVPFANTVETQKTAIQTAEAAAATADFASLARIVSDLESPFLTTASPETKRWLETHAVPRALRASHAVEQTRLPDFKDPVFRQERIFIGHMLEAVGASRPVLASPKVAAWMRASVYLLHAASKWEAQGRADLAAENLRVSRAIATFLAQDDEGFGVVLAGSTPDTLNLVGSNQVLTGDTFVQAKADDVANAAFNALRAPFTFGVLATRPDALYQLYGVATDRLFATFDRYYQTLSPDMQRRLKAYRDAALEVALGANPLASAAVNSVYALTGRNLAGVPLTEVERLEAWVGLLGSGLGRFQAMSEANQAAKELDPKNAKRAESIFNLLIGTEADTDFVFEMRASNPHLSGVTYSEYFDAIKQRTSEGAQRAKDFGLDAVLTGAKSASASNPTWENLRGRDQLFTYMIRATPSEVLGLRFHGGTDSGGPMFLPANEVDGLTLDQIADRYSIPRHAMTYVVPMTIERGDVISIHREPGHRIFVRRNGNHQIQGADKKLELRPGERFDSRKIFE